MENILGSHILIEAYDCDPKVLDDVELVEEVMVDAALKAGAEIREVAFHKFSPQGVSGVVVISESHLSVHTWPEVGYAAVDVFTCGDTVDPIVAVDYIRDKFQARRALTSEVKRGIFEEHNIKKISPG
ncbi:MAG: adenosylmethionine decarboxylase [Bacillota bacterium]|jgi:S-adenosylmethionine decarboxylase|nr:adenosylmethionine decarboxylase [Bacillota bacterium]MDI9414865.1 adenosylmethionine decarboxylase [Bacillota bacterium]NLD13080.1 S-adenosylmethionine decarboxylase proenzyme [Bacillota bacterium]HAV20593.1 S-adenosylmethionine decarboxylase proenzyme [Bacillota bacterium]HCD41595.1 S-adenosylmethionine decarboxylase proenzyme [Bacillota bacterium]